MQLFPQIAQGVGFAVPIGGDRGAAGGGEIRTIKAELGQFDAKAGNFVGQGESVGQGVVNLAQDTSNDEGPPSDDARRAFCVSVCSRSAKTRSLQVTALAGCLS